MNDTINALIALDEDVDTPVVEAALPPGGKVVLAGLIEGLGNVNGALDDHAADVLVVACGGASTAAVDLVRDVSSKRREPPVIAFCEMPPDYFVHALFDAGADDVVKLPETPERVLFAFQKAIARGRGRDATRPTTKAPMICVLGPKGGTGKTLTSCNLAVALAGLGKKVALVDLDLQFGDVGLALGLAPDRTLYDLAKSGGSLDIEKLESYLTMHSSGARVLLAPTRPDQASFVTVELLRDVYATLRSHYDLVIVDTPPGFTPEVIASIDSSSHVCMVGMLDSLSLKNTKLGLETLELMGYDNSRINVVLNRADTRIGISRDDVASIVGRTPDVLVPSDREIPKLLTDGVTIVAADERSEAAAAFRLLAKLYADAISTNGSGPIGRTDGRPAKPAGKEMLRTLLGRR
jgi:pilus assembly protein CpaE